MQKLHSRQILIKRKHIYLFFAILIGLLLIAPSDIAWINDRINYLIYAKDSWAILENRFQNGIIYVLTNEPLFLLINNILSTMGQPETVLTTIIFSSALITLIGLGKISNYNLWVLFFFLFVSLILKNYTMTLRQGLALGIYLIALTNNWKYRDVFKFLSMFVHTSTIIFICFEILEKLLKRINFSFILRLLVSTIFITLIILVIPSVADFLGDRRAEFYSIGISDNVTGLNFLVWLLVGTLYIFLVNNNKYKIFCSYVIIFYLVSYFLFPIGARIFEAVLPVIMATAVSDERREVRILFIVFFLAYGVLLWNSPAGLSGLLSNL